MDEQESAPCRFIERCPMFPLFQSRSALRVYQEVYCRGRFETCERYQLASKGEMPAPSLLPDGGRAPKHWLEPPDRDSIPPE
jgi:hypothetical protein